ncbi:MAG: YcaO-like family protein [Pseudomonadota bacterium]
MPENTPHMTYRLELTRNTANIGFYACVPENSMSIEEIARYLEQIPNDQFMHSHFLALIAELKKDDLNNLFLRNKENVIWAAAYYETLILSDSLKLAAQPHDKYSQQIAAGDFKILAKEGQQVILKGTPLIFIKWALAPDQELRLFWNNIFLRNIDSHELQQPEHLPQLTEESSKLIREIGATKDKVACIHLSELAIPCHNQADKELPTRSVPPGVTAKKAIERLSSVGLISEPERKMGTFMAPYAFRRMWRMDISTFAGRNRFRLKGDQTSYGKGLSEEGARASCLMEMVERYSAFASWADEKSVGYKGEFRLVKSRLSALLSQGVNALDPNALSLEVAYTDDELYWISAEELTLEGRRSILVPAQCVFLFSNFDEPCLATGISSNGIASGNTLAEARLHALLEYIERDSERVGLYSMRRSFLLHTTGTSADIVMKKFERRGLLVQFLDLTSELGIPCYKAFVQTKDGSIIKGTGAGLNGKAAILSALSELSCPLFTESMPPPSGLQVLRYEELPDYSTNDIAGDLNLLERLLLLNKLRIVYVDLTRSDIDIPVVRAIIPGLEFMPVLDRFSGISRRQFLNYLES